MSLQELESNVGDEWWWCWGITEVIGICLARVGEYLGDEWWCRGIVEVMGRSLARVGQWLGDKCGAGASLKL